ncbi:MAG: hypothetical protein PHE68_04500 [Candidatus Peribacteraceae bacterium]|nr:hypothetical protein [Candidatus Peribacteraceae bacterium]MDD5074556.1 hypothetical protein [Candidatus Peribacteraceae bacterium]
MELNKSPYEAIGTVSIDPCPREGIPEGPVVLSNGSILPSPA